MTVLITFPCFYSKIETKPKIGMFRNKATKGTATPPSREINKENNSAGLLQYFPRCAFL